MKSYIAALALGLLVGPVALAQTPAPAAVYLPQAKALPAADQLIILDLIARMNQSIDSNDYGAYAGFYTENGVIDSGFGESTKGRAAIVASLNQSAPFITNKRHVASNVLINSDGQLAIATYYLIVFERQTGLTIAGSAMITDEFRRGTTGWQVVRHTTRMDPATLQAMSAAMVAGR